MACPPLRRARVPRSWCRVRRSCWPRSGCPDHAVRWQSGEFICGDIRTLEDTAAVLELTGADGVMIGRGAFGQPWIFQSLLEGTTPGLEERWSVVLEHIQLMHEFYGDKSGARISRKHIEAYGQTLGFDPRPGLRLECPREQLAWLRTTCADELETKLAA